MFGRGLWLISPESRCRKDILHDYTHTDTLICGETLSDAVRLSATAETEPKPIVNTMASA